MTDRMTGGAGRSTERGGLSDQVPPDAAAPIESEAHPTPDGWHMGLPLSADTPASPPPRSRRATRRVVVLLGVLGVVVVATIAALGVLRPLIADLTESNDYPGPGVDPVSVTIEAGATGRDMGATLEDAGVVKTAKAFADAYGADQRSGGIQPGQYELRTEMSAAEALAVLVDPANRTVQRVTIPEGLWNSEVFALLAAATGHDVAEYQAAAANPADLGLPASADGQLEGWLFPASYEFTSEVSAADQVRQMIAQTSAQLARSAVPAEQAERVLIVASIVEAEGRRGEDRPKIARVVENRLAEGMRLQLDSTVSYASQVRSITTTDAQRATPSPWNTYLVEGLPAGPIGNPGASAIDAALHPADGPWRYFVAVNPETGETHFSTTMAEHDADVAQFQAWCQQRPGTC